MMPLNRKRCSIKTAALKLHQTIIQTDEIFTKTNTCDCKELKLTFIILNHGSGSGKNFQWWLYSQIHFYSHTELFKQNANWLLNSKVLLNKHSNEELSIKANNNPQKLCLLQRRWVNAPNIIEHRLPLQIFLQQQS